MVDRHATLFHQLFEVPVVQRLGHLSLDADEDDVDRKTHAFEVEHVDSSWVRGRSLPDYPVNVPHATEPQQLLHLSNSPADYRAAK